MTVIEYLESRGFNPLQDVEKGDWEDSIHLHELIENCIEAINKNSVIPDVVQSTCCNNPNIITEVYTFMGNNGCYEVAKHSKCVSCGEVESI